MLIIFHGQDTIASYRAFRRLLNSLISKRPTTSVFWLDPDNFQTNHWQELLASSSLFSGRYLIAGRRLLSNQMAKNELLAAKDNLKQSEHIFLLWEEIISADVKPLLEAADRVKHYILKNQVSSSAFNIFSLADALGQKDRKQLWLLLIQAEAVGLSAEEVYWRLFDQVKKLTLVKTVSQPKNLTQPPFNYRPFYVNKLATQADNYNLEELKALAVKLLTIYRHNRLGRQDLFLGLENLAMTV